MSGILIPAGEMDSFHKGSSSPKDIAKGGASVDLVMTYVDSDVQCWREIPWAIREYMNTMYQSPRPAIVLQSIQQFGARATMLALRERQQLDGFSERAEEHQRRKKAAANA